MKADPSAQLKLLDIQEIDSRIMQLRHQLRNLPETKEIEALEAQRRAVDNRARDARISRDDLATAQSKAEKDVESVRSRRDREQQRLDQGLVTHAKDIERLQAELANITRRIEVLEDEELEVMAHLEDAERTLSELDAEIAGFDDKIATLTAARAERSAEAEKDLAQIAGERPAAVEGMPADLMALYDRIREQRGVGAAELRARQCGGCRLTIDAAELSQIRQADAEEVLRHEDCGVILVRTPESGL